MHTTLRSITVGDLTVEVIRKRIKHLHLRVYPPDGRVRVSAPTAVSTEAIRMAIVGRLDWIKRQQAKVLSQPRQSQPAMTNGERHPYLGQGLSLRITERVGPSHVILHDGECLEICVPPGSNVEQRSLALQRWYREQMLLLIPPLLAKWQLRLGVQAAEWGVRQMKTRWGSCNVRTHRICLNLELIKKPPAHLEYVIVHELAHLLEKGHNARFYGLLDAHLPGWRALRAELNGKQGAIQREAD